MNAGIIAEYRKSLLRLVKAMIYGYTKELLELFRDNKEELKQIAMDEDISEKAKKTMDMLNAVYAKYFTQHATTYAEQMVSKTARVVKTNWAKEYAKFMLLIFKEAQKHPEDKIFSEFIKNNFKPINLAEKKFFKKEFALNKQVYAEISQTIKKTTINNNVELIKSIQQQYHREVSQAIYDSIINGESPSKIKDKLLVAGAKTKRRAKLIAQDQCNKTHSSLLLQQYKQDGITQAKWQHIGGGKTDRKTHKHLINNKIFNIYKGIYDPAVGKYIQPSELPFCRCQAVAVVEV